MAPVSPGAVKGDYPWWLVALAAIALALAVGGVVILFYLMSIVQWHENTGL